MKQTYTCARCDKSKKSKAWPKGWEAVYPQNATICDECAPLLDRVREEMAVKSKMAADGVWSRWLDA